MARSTAAIIGLSAGYLALAGAVGFLAFTWIDRQRQAVALGFDNYFEQRTAAKAGIADPGEFHEWETKQRVEAETQRRRDEIAQRPVLACTAAQLAIKERLASPGSAKFPYCGDWPGHVMPEGPDRWLVTSWVDMPDGSGVIRQRGYQVSVTRGADGWRTFILRLP